MILLLKHEIFLKNIKLIVSNMNSIIQYIINIIIIIIQSFIIYIVKENNNPFFSFYNKIELMLILFNNNKSILD